MGPRGLEAGRLRPAGSPGGMASPRLSWGFRAGMAPEGLASSLLLTVCASARLGTPAASVRPGSNDTRARSLRLRPNESVHVKLVQGPWPTVGSRTAVFIAVALGEKAPSTWAQAAPQVPGDPASPPAAQRVLAAVCEGVEVGR